MYRTIFERFNGDLIFMYGREHILATVSTVAFFLIFIGISQKESFLRPVIDPIMLSIVSTPHIIIIATILILLGSLLPDADSVDRGSKIFYTPFAPIAHLIHNSEKWIANLLGMNTGHRESLHTIKGVFLSSAIVVGFISFIVLLLFGSITRADVALFYTVLLIAQFFHLLQDKVNHLPSYMILLVFTLTTLSFFPVAKIPALWSFDFVHSDSDFTGIYDQITIGSPDTELIKLLNQYMEKGYQVFYSNSESTNGHTLTVIQNNIAIGSSSRVTNGDSIIIEQDETKVVKKVMLFKKDKLVKSKIL